MKIAAIIQARTSSTRLPKKVLKDLPYDSGVTVLQQVIMRLKKSKKIDEIIVTTTKDKQDKLITALSEKERVKHFKGSKENVLERYYLAAKENNVDVIVRVTSDCPCIDPLIVDSVISRHLDTYADYTSNFSYPIGLGVEVFNFNALEKAYKSAKILYDKEHVTPYIKKHANLFKIIKVKAPKDFRDPNIRITLDTIEDYVLLCIVFDYLYKNGEVFSAYDIINLFKRKPWLKLINNKVIQKREYTSLEDELKESLSLLGLQGLERAKKFINRHLPI